MIIHKIYFICEAPLKWQFLLPLHTTPHILYLDNALFFSAAHWIEISLSYCKMSLTVGVSPASPQQNRKLLTSSSAL